MSYSEKRNVFRPESGEAPFDVGEVFFSRTDERGVIRASNYVFRRVANFEWEDMLGAPHKIIRHPDMPSGVFWLFWNKLKQGKPIGAYVKNRAKDGLYYWVFAVAAPNGDGYLSARIKPTSPLRQKIELEYEALRKAEHDEGLSPEASAARLLKRLEQLGFPEYEEFSAHALSAELAARDTAIGEPVNAKINRFQRVVTSAENLRVETEGLIDEFISMRTIPHNMRVIASRLEPTGGPISTLSKNYGAISQEMSDWFENNIAGDRNSFAAIHGTIISSMFLEGMALILHECEEQLNRERRNLGDVEIENERQVLTAQTTQYVAKAATGISQVRDEADRILRACQTMNRHVLGLSSTRVLCKIESGRTPGAGDGLEDIIRQLGVFQERIGSRISKIEKESEEILLLTS